MGFNRLKPRMKTTLRRQFSLLFTMKFPEIAGIHFLLTSDYWEGQPTQILKYDPKKGVSVVAKMLFPQLDEGFWLY